MYATRIQNVSKTTLAIKVRDIHSVQGPVRDFTRSAAVIVSFGGGRSEAGDATYGILEVGNKVVAVLVLLETGKRHLCAGDVLFDAGQGQPPSAGQSVNTHLLGVLKVLEEGVLVPGDTLVHVRSGVRVALALASLTTENAGKCPSATGDACRGTRRTRAGWGRLCVARQHRECGTAHNES